MLAVVTRRLPMTNTKDQRIVVTGGHASNRKVYTWSDNRSVEDNHRDAARDFITALGWDLRNLVWVRGSAPFNSGDDYYFVAVPDPIDVRDDNDPDALTFTDRRLDDDE